jgi:3-oxoacyl-[acyl-carrier-protein] synthase III
MQIEKVYPSTVQRFLKSSLSGYADNIRSCKQLRKKAANKNYKKTKKQLKSIIQKGGKKDKFEVTTLQNLDERKLNKMKISNYINDNIDWGMMPGPPPTDCVIM